MDYIICYTNHKGYDVWEEICGEDAMQFRVDDLMKELDCDADDIMVFIKHTQLR